MVYGLGCMISPSSNGLQCRPAASSLKMHEIAEKRRRSISIGMVTTTNTYRWAKST